MLNGARTQTTPAGEPAQNAGRDPEALSWPRRTGARVDRVRGRALAIAPRAPGYEHALGAVRHDQRHAGGLLAGALAFRRFGALLPLALLVAVAGRIERASETYGSLGVAFTLLFWLFVVSRVIVASAMLNAALALERRPAPEEVLHP
jgi:uncharacterized BrkB/YihY/UPF0761 family membrane protein